MNFDYEAIFSGDPISDLRQLTAVRLDANVRGHRQTQRCGIDIESITS
jgi:hypothetical protein